MSEKVMLCYRTEKARKRGRPRACRLVNGESTQMLSLCVLGFPQSSLLGFVVSETAAERSMQSPRGRSPGLRGYLHRPLECWAITKSGNWLDRVTGSFDKLSSASHDPIM